MIQIQAINDMLNTNNIDIYLGQGIGVEHFNNFKQEFEFLKSHHTRYGKAPDLTTFLNRFPDFQIVEVMEPAKYIIYNLKEEYLYNKGVGVFKDCASILEQNSFEGLQRIISKASELLNGTTMSDGVNINNLLEEKKKDLEEKRSKGGMLGISTGMKELDKVLHGWLPGEELVTIVGRVNQGKSWLLQKFLTEANKQGKKVLQYSGEMGIMQVAYRHDTLGLNYSNRTLTTGQFSDAEYNAYMRDLEDANNREEYRVVTPNDFGGKPMTITMLRTLIKRYKPDIVGVDQLSLMEDERRVKGDTTRLQYTHLAQDLFSLSIEFGIPILVDAQANRNKADIENPENPELADIGESDGVAQNSSRVISLVQTKSGLSLKITKNRFGENNKKFLYVWDIDKGIFRFIEEEQNSNTIETDLPIRNAKPPQEAEDVF